MKTLKTRGNVLKRDKTRS